MGNQTANEKHATGKHALNFRTEVRIGTWDIRKLKELGKLHICNKMDRNEVVIRIAVSKLETRLFSSPAKEMLHTTMEHSYN